MYTNALTLIEDIPLELSGSALLTQGFLSPVCKESNAVSVELLRELSHSTDGFTCYVANNEPMLLPDRRNAYITSFESIQQHRRGIHFLDVPGSTGKIFHHKIHTRRFLIQWGHLNCSCVVWRRSDLARWW